MSNLFFLNKINNCRNNLILSLQKTNILVLFTLKTRKVNTPCGNFEMLSRLNKLELCAFFLLNDKLT